MYYENSKGYSLEQELQRKFGFKINYTTRFDSVRMQTELIFIFKGHSHRLYVPQGSHPDDWFTYIVQDLETDYPEYFL